MKDIWSQTDWFQKPASSDDLGTDKHAEEDLSSPQKNIYPTIIPAGRFAYWKGKGYRFQQVLAYPLLTYANPLDFLARITNTQELHHLKDCVDRHLTSKVRRGLAKDLIEYFHTEAYAFKTQTWPTELLKIMPFQTCINIVSSFFLF